MPRIVPILALLTAAMPAAGGVESLSARSPFLPPSAPQASAANNALTAIELTGIFTIHGKPKFSVRDTASGRSLWIALGETQEGLTIVSYDEALSSVVVEGRGAQRNIVIREASVASAAPAAPAVVNNNTPPIFAARAPGAPQRAVTLAPPVPSSKLKKQFQDRDPKVVEKERDARMLVSDLMEISIQERKRYEENQRRAAQGLPRLDPGQPLPESP